MYSNCNGVVPTVQPRCMVAVLPLLAMREVPICRTSRTG
ncbi:hypothetical protein PI172_2093 [Prevotella intermedia]|uniref:Uncharacterized protein n=1 Tax=Prevotella intermedia TaxID=28131 RepID=A0AAD1BLD1_PREIN|nr:hypothetical protein PIN17_0008 [Prevotella intermedia 17]BAR96821.1 hypothetical protein PI172_2093 [Prevotella intermedia]